MRRIQSSEELALQKLTGRGLRVQTDEQCEDQQEPCIIGAAFYSQSEIIHSPDTYQGPCYTAPYVKCPRMMPGLCLYEPHSSFLEKKHVSVQLRLTWKCKSQGMYQGLWRCSGSLLSVNWQGCHRNVALLVRMSSCLWQAEAWGRKERKGWSSEKTH